MTEKNKKNTQQKEKEGGDSKKSTTVVLKADLHCEGCSSKLLKSIRSFHGVDSARIESGQKMTVVGRVDAAELREHVEKKTHNKVELISPQTTGKNGIKEKENISGNKSGGKEDKKKKESEMKSKNVEKKPNEKEPPPVTTAVLKMNLHCQGCMEKIRKRVTKTKGYRDMKIDRQKELVTVVGAMDMKALAEGLKKHLKRNVEILPQPKAAAAEKKESGGEEKEKKSSGGEKENKSGGGEKENKSGGHKGKSGGGEGGEAGGGNVEVKRAQIGGAVHPNTYPILSGSGFSVDQVYNYYPDPLHAPQLFSDENPNACSIM